MERTIFQVKVLNPYQSKVPKGFYHPTRGHTGVDLAFKSGDTLLSPVTGTVVKVLVQKEMGKTLYLRHDATGDIWVFAHNATFLYGIGDKVKRRAQLVITGNTGSKTTAPHSHVEVITAHPVFPEDKIMKRALAGFVGYNTNPLKRAQKIYELFSIPSKEW